MCSTVAPHGVGGDACAALASGKVEGDDVRLRSLHHVGIIIAPAMTSGGM